MKVKVANPDLNQEERTYLTSDYTSGTALTVRNNEGFTDEWYAIVGEHGQEQTEAGLISSTSNNDTINVDSALDFSHPKSTPIYLSQWNQISFERKPSGGAYSVNQTVNIEWDNEDKETLIVVTGGATTDTYRWRFYNEQTGTYSDYSDELAGTGLTRNSVGFLIQQVKRNPMAQNIDDEIIIDYFNDYQSDVVYPEIPKAWWFSKEGTQVSTTADTYKYSVSNNWSDFLSMKLMLYRYVSGSNDITYPLSFSPIQEFYNLKSDSNQATDDYAKYWSLLPPDSSSAKGYIGLHPTPDTTNCYLAPVYFYDLTALDSFGDTIVVPYPKGYIDYALYRIHDDIKSDSSNADKFNARVGRSITYLKRLNRRQLGQPELFRFRGSRGWSRQYGEQSYLDGQTAKELYW